MYPKSGSAYKKERESFFRKDLTELYIQWKDCTKYIFQLGDHNCPHRSEDSLYNSSQHLQKGLISHLQVQGLSDNFLNVHGRNVIMYSRITATSKTRIDYIFSNTSSCNYFQYLPVAGLDHCAALARYDINFEIVKEVIPSDRYFQGWVISRFLECDDVFLEQAEFIIRHVFEESRSGDKDPSFYWIKVKSSLISLAKTREKEIKYEKSRKMSVLKGFYSSILKDLEMGKDCLNELDEIKCAMNNVYQKTSRVKIDKMRGLQIVNYTYDINKLQNKRKYEGQTRINEIEISGVKFSGTKDVVHAIQEMIAGEVGTYNDVGMDSPMNVEEQYFLSLI